MEGASVMRHIITRASPDGEHTVSLFHEAGLSAIAAPLFTVTAITPPPVVTLDGVSALIFTSANGVRYFPNQTRTLPVFAVGDATRRQAEKQHFTHILTAHGSSDELFELIVRHASHDDGVLYHGTQRHPRSMLKKRLEQAGFEVRQQVLYDVHPADTLPANLMTSLTSREPCCVTFYSPRTAQIFASLLPDKDCLRHHDCCCLSDTVASIAAPLGWRHCHISNAPTTNAMIDLLARRNLTP